MKPSDYRRLPSSLENIGITGGEPFVRPDIIDVIHNISLAAPKARLIINTNGFLTSRIIEAMESLNALPNRIGIRVSMDGVGEMHDKIRGTRHAYKKALETVKRLKESGLSDLGLSFTSTPTNIKHLTKVYELSRQLEIDFAGSVAQNSKIYFHKDSNTGVPKDTLCSGYNEVIARELTSRSIKSWFRAYFNHGVIVFNDTGKRLVECSAAKDYFYLDPHGTVFPCLTLDQPFGSLKEAEFEEVWRASSAREVRRNIEGCNNCWMMCSARSDLKKRPARAAAWVLREKARLLLKRPKHRKTSDLRTTIPLKALP